MHPTPMNASDDLGRCDLGDRRLNKRLTKITDALQARPAMSFPRVFGDDASSEAFYRFMANAKVSWQPLFDGHTTSTRARASEAGSILAIHDTTLCQFGGSAVRAGTFRTAKSKSGFLAHTCLAVSADGTRRPLGVLGMIPVVRLEGDAAAASPGVTYANESQRWLDLVVAVDDEVPADVGVVHVMDSEGDNYDLLEHMVGIGADFVVRLCHDRRVVSYMGQERLFSTLGRGITQLTRSVSVSRRTPPTGAKKTGRHAARDERICSLDVNVLDANILRPAGSKAPFAALNLHVVHVVEPSPPEGQEPVSWVLATTLPVETPEQVERVIDAYRARWMIEEWFKALKTGCAYEKRQLESMGALLTAFAMLAPIATRLLALRWIARTEPERPGTVVLSAAELSCLRLMERRKKRALPAEPTVHDVMLAIARIGGFLKSNKAPGWQTIGRGFEEFLTMFEMFQIMQGGEGDEM